MNTKALRQKVLDLAIHGKLVPQNPNDESATVLLEKIRAEKVEKIKKGELKADKKDSFIFVGSDKRHYEKFADGSVKDIEDEIPFDVPDGWAWCRLKQLSLDMADGPFGSNLKAEHYTKNKEARIIQLSNIGEYGWREENTKYTTLEHAKNNISRSIVEPGNVVIAKMMPAGRAIICPNNEKMYVLSSDAVKLVPTSLINSNYLLNSINSPFFRASVTDNVQGTTRLRTSISKLRECFFPLPPLKEQILIVHAIENAISHIDVLEQNKMDLQNLITQAKSKILDLAIHGKLVPQDPNDEHAEELLKRIATSDNRPYEKVELSEIDWTLPNNWCLCHFGDIATVINGKNQSKVENQNGKYPIYGSGGKMGRADDYICPENCTIIGRKGSINNPIFVEEKFWNVDTAFGLCPSEAILPKFLFYFCEYFDFTTLDSSTTLPSITKTNIQQIIFALPPIEEQKRILDKTEELFGKLDEIVLNLI
jgi:type I restriction enzyme S subunit